MQPSLVPHRQTLKTCPFSSTALASVGALLSTRPNNPANEPMNMPTLENVRPTTMIARATQRSAIFCALLLAVCTLASYPFAEIGGNDDFAYVRSAKTLADT